ncbi:MAG: hypothetical protein WBN10_03750 [Polyangiales bacterium]
MPGVVVYACGRQPIDRLEEGEEQAGREIGVEPDGFLGGLGFFVDQPLGEEQLNGLVGPYFGGAPTGNDLGVDSLRFDLSLPSIFATRGSVDSLTCVPEADGVVTGP